MRTHHEVQRALASRQAETAVANPHALVAALLRDPRPTTFSLTCERVPATVRTHGRDATTTELRRAIMSTEDRAVTTWLLDTATLHRLTPLSPGEARAIATGPVLWRYLDALGEPVDSDPRSPYEKLMLDVLHDEISLPVAAPAAGPTVA